MFLSIFIRWLLHKPPSKLDDFIRGKIIVFDFKNRTRLGFKKTFVIINNIYEILTFSLIIPWKWKLSRFTVSIIYGKLIKSVENNLLHFSHTFLGVHCLATGYLLLNSCTHLAFFIIKCVIILSILVKHGKHLKQYNILNILKHKFQEISKMILKICTAYKFFWW